MSSIKMIYWSLICVLFFSYPVFGQIGSFTDMECVQGNFSSSISHKGGPLGLFDVNLKVEKENCVITVSHDEYMILGKRWIVDICRGPIHFKYGTKGVEVFKRKGFCNPVEKNDPYCEKLNDLKRILEDDGLIFAPGERDNIRDQHGQIYCSFLLIDTYLQRGMLFNRHARYDKVLNRGQHAVPVIKAAPIGVTGDSEGVETGD